MPKENGNKMDAPVILKDLIAHLPLVVEEVDPYFGTFICLDLVGDEGDAMRIRIYLCDWLFFDGLRTIVTSKSSINDFKLLSDFLLSCKLIDIFVCDVNCIKLVFEFNKSIILNANFHEYERGDDLVRFVFPGYIVGYSPEHGFTKELSAKLIH